MTTCTCYDDRRPKHGKYGAASPAAPDYPPDDGPLSPEAVAAIRAAAPEGATYQVVGFMGGIGDPLLHTDNAPGREPVYVRRAAPPAQTPAPPQKEDLLGSSGTAVDRDAGSQCQSEVAEPSGDDCPMCGLNNDDCSCNERG